MQTTRVVLVIEHSTHIAVTEAAIMETFDECGDVDWKVSVESIDASADSAAPGQ